MIGLGCGARSYTQALHYSNEYAVGQRGVRAVLEAYLARPDDAFDRAEHGYRLGPEDQRRRYVLQSLLSDEGMPFEEYASRFDSAVLDDLPELAALEGIGLLAHTADRLALTDSGLERSDAIGPWLYSEKVRLLMEDYEWR